MKKIIYLFAIVATMFSCSDLLDEQDANNGHVLTGGSVIIGWDKSIVNENYFENIGTIDTNYPVSVLGGAGDGSINDKTISFSISVDSDLTTAISGEYELNEMSGTILPGSDFGNLSLGVVTGNFSSDAPTKLVLNVTTTVDGVVVSSHNKKMTIKFVGCLSTLDDYTYHVVTQREDGATVDRGVEILVPDGVNKFWSKSVGLWTTNNALNGSTPDGRGVNFEDICGVITIPKHSLGNVYGNEVEGTSVTSLDEAGNFVLKYSILFSGVPTNYTSTYTKQ